MTDIEGARCLVVLGDSVTTDHISPAGAIPRDMPAGRYLPEHGVEPRDFNSFGARRGNHEVMVRGTFGNIRLRNALADGREGSYTAHLPSGEALTIFEAAERYRAEGVPLVALVGKEYGSGSSRDWAAKGTLLLGIRAVIAESYERIHRSNLVGMGVLPLQYVDGQTAASLGLDGRERFTIRGIAGGVAPHARLTVEAVADDGRATRSRCSRASTRRPTPSTSPRRHPPARPAAHDRRGLSHHVRMSSVPTVLNEPILTYAPGSPERAEIRRRSRALRGEQPEIPLVIGGRERTTGDVREQREPQLHERVCATWPAAGAAEAAQAIDAALAARARLEQLAARRPLRGAAARGRPARRGRGARASTPRR